VGMGAQADGMVYEAQVTDKNFQHIGAKHLLGEKRNEKNILGV
jgi:hypothetical protein